MVIDAFLLVHAFAKEKRGEGAEERMDEIVRLDAFLINDVTGKIACLKSVWLPCMYDRKIDYSWRKESERDEKRKKENHGPKNRRLRGWWMQTS